MKLLSIVVPSYNSQAYLETCLKSLLSAGGDSVEILIVNDGSKDQTPAMADDFARRYPTIVRAIHQENGGHGEAVNAGIRNATGLYLKVVDSDDWVDTAAYEKILSVLAQMQASGAPVDLIVSNFVYEKVGAKKKKTMKYGSVLPVEKTVTWDEVGKFGLGQYLMMHSLMYRTQVLRDSGMILPKHTFYVDNLFVYVPLDWVKTIHYVDVDFYRYFVGRDDQSVNEAVMIKRIDQQLKVNRLVLQNQQLGQLLPLKLRELKFHQLEIICAISLILLIRSNLSESDAKAEALWNDIKAWDEDLYRRMRRGFFGRLLTLPGKGGRRLAVATYELAQKLFGFN